MINSKTVFAVVEKDGQTTVQHLQIYVLALRESFHRGELSSIYWITGKQNQANLLTNPVLSLISPL